jgi:curli biogenesis system outer membrane secretion channel CsgG
MKPDLAQPGDRMPRLVFAVAFLAALAVGTACSTPATRTGPGATAAAAASPEPGPRVVCEYERPTGSNIPVRTCRPVADDLQRNRARDAATDDLNRPQTQSRSGH